MLDLIRHWNPKLKQCLNNKAVYISSFCWFCDGNGKKIFRYHTKLKVAKCYNCGRSFKEFSWFLYQKKEIDSPVNDINVKIRYGCETFEETLLPF